jgi:hypothetical protein
MLKSVLLALGPLGLSLFRVVLESHLHGILQCSQLSQLLGDRLLKHAVEDVF